MLPPRIDELINALLDGEASEQMIAELQSLIGDDTDLASQLVDRIAEHRLLGVLYQPFDPMMCVNSIMQVISDDNQAVAESIFGEIEKTETDKVRGNPDGAFPGNGSKYLIGLAVGVALSLTIVAVGWYFRPPPSRGGAFADKERNAITPSGRPVATLLLAENCVWNSGSPFEEGQRLPAQTLDLKSGAAVVRFDGGAELVMTGEASLALRSAGQAELRHGSVVVRATGGAAGFQLTTPASPLVDLGTEFAVRVDRSGATEVHVLEGEVQYLKQDSPSVLRAGKAIQFDVAKQVKDVAVNSPRFEEIIRRVNPKPQPHRMLAYEGFHYEPGFLPLKQTIKGLGWAGPWRLRLPQERTRPSREESPKQFEIVHGQLNVTWPVPGGRKGMLKLPKGSIYYVRPLRKSIDLDRDGVTFFSLMIRETHRRVDRRRPRERLRLTFRASKKYYTEFVSFGHGTGYRPHIQAGVGGSHTSPLVLPAEQTTLWIGKIISRKQGEDEIYFRVYGEKDVLGYAEPADWHVVTRGVELNGHLDRVLLSCNGESPRIVDELRIGPTWRSVAPMLVR